MVLMYFIYIQIRESEVADRGSEENAAQRLRLPGAHKSRKDRVRVAHAQGASGARCLLASLPAIADKSQSCPRAATSRRGALRSTRRLLDELVHLEHHFEGHLVWQGAGCEKRVQLVGVVLLRRPCRAWSDMGESPRGVREQGHGAASRV